MVRQTRIMFIEVLYMILVVWAVWVKIGFQFTLVLDSDRCLVYPGLGSVRILVYSGLGTDKILVYSGLDPDMILVYSGADSDMILVCSGANSDMILIYLKIWVQTKFLFIRVQIQ